MDPDATLEELRDLVQRESDGGDGSHAADIVERFQALDAWITRGGFPPRAWASHDVREVR
jgi:hypothetical protein